MSIKTFISVGENIHCTRIYKVNGAFCKPDADGETYHISFKTSSGASSFPVPSHFMENADWQAGKVKHCAAAIWQGVYGSGDAQASAIDYLHNLARRQEAAGATWLDINVDEFSTDLDERMRLIQWTVDTLQAAVSIPMCIDSSNLDILKAGLAQCDVSRGAPMVNSVSLERTEAIDVAQEAGAAVIASAAGADGLPNSVEERMKNLQAVFALLTDIGMVPSSIHFDPLVFPISTDGGNGTRFLDTVRSIRETWGQEVHIVAGLSNISFGMPNRKLINQVFTWLACEAGADGGIVDPMQINLNALNRMDPETQAFRLTKALLLGEDDFGMEFITAAREGQLE